MPKYRLEIDVYEAALKRTEWTFDNFEKVYLSFSAGKDSTVMLHIAMEVAKKRNQKIGILIVDLEGQYKLTEDHIYSLMDEYKDFIDLYWVCLPLHLRNAVSVYEPFWKCWDKERESEWIRKLPNNVISDESYFNFFTGFIDFYGFNFYYN